MQSPADSWTKILADENIQFSTRKPETPVDDQIRVSTGDSRLRAKEKIRCATENSKDTEVKLRVIGVGLPGTGTASLKAALEILGFGPVLCDHRGKTSEFIRLIDVQTTQLKFQNSLMGAKSTAEKLDKGKVNLPRLERDSGVSLADLTLGYAAVLDSPMIEFYPELLHLHPNAHVILSICSSPSVWWQTYDSAIGKLVDPSWRGVLLRIFLWPVREEAHALEEKIRKFWEVKYGAGMGGWGEGIYERHSKEVMGFVEGQEGRSGRLLVWNAEEGWDTLCQFLDVPVPKREFPRLHDEKEMRGFVGKNYRYAVFVWVCYFLAVAWVVFLVSNSDG